jgi:hypothetical protein
LPAYPTAQTNAFDGRVQRRLVVQFRLSAHQNLSVEGMERGESF